jgi:hypothetical protein
MAVNQPIALEMKLSGHSLLTLMWRCKMLLLSNALDARATNLLGKRTPNPFQLVNPLFPTHPSLQTYLEPSLLLNLLSHPGAILDQTNLPDQAHITFSSSLRMTTRMSK